MTPHLPYRYAWTYCLSRLGMRCRRAAACLMQARSSAISNAATAPELTHRVRTQARHRQLALD